MNALVIILVYPVGLIIGLFLSELMGYSMDEWPTQFEQSIMKIGFGILIGFGIGITQWLLIKKVFNISKFWLYSVTIGFIIFELIAGIILWKMDINRGELSFIEGDSMGHTIILASTGLLIGLIQLPILKKHYSGVFYWVFASTLAWGVSVLTTAIGQESEILLLITFILGALLYGAITGATLIWILKPREIKP
jgi:hypothetical protein